MAFDKGESSGRRLQEKRRRTQKKKSLRVLWKREQRDRLQGCSKAA